MLVSIIEDPRLKYGDAEQAYSPSERYPEHAGVTISAQENSSYRAVRDTFIQAKLDAARIGTPQWNPLGQFIAPGSAVFVLCNFVYHKRPAETQEHFTSKCTHAAVLRPILDYVLLATGPAGRVSFGNSPLQSCRWDDVLRETGAAKLVDYYRARKAPVSAIDLRLHVAERTRSGRITRQFERDNSAGVAINLDDGSLLNAVDSPHVRYRVSDYNPDRTEHYHHDGRHSYVIHRAVLESDVIFSVPKMKTHEKVGITCTVKGFVGAVGHKDSLAHHRFGSPRCGGDEYPADSAILSFISRFHDALQRRKSHGLISQTGRIMDRVLRKIARSRGYVQVGAWDGNDTTWRMAVDLARLLHFADKAGKIVATPQRQHLSLIDGIVGGEGEGPLSPEPVNVGTLIFGDNVALVDWAACTAMGFDPSLIPIVRECFGTDIAPANAWEQADIMVNGETVDCHNLASHFEQRFRPPKGWASLQPHEA